MTELKLGQVVRCLTEYDGNSMVKDKIGFVRHITGNVATVQFFEKIGGHRGFDSDGLDGHCWSIDKRSLSLLYEGMLIPNPVPKTVPLPPPVEPIPVFKVGDIVCFIPGQSPSEYRGRGPFKYSIGMVRVTDMDATLHYGVEFFSSFKGGHDLGSDKCPEGHGWWIEGEDLTLRHRIDKLEQCLKCMDENRGFDEDEDDDA